MKEPLSCDCPEIKDLGEFELLEESSVDLFPYDESISRIIFSDEQGTEFSAEVDYYYERFDSFTHHQLFPCIGIVTDSFQHTYKQEKHATYFIFSELEMKVRVNLKVQINLIRDDENIPKPHYYDHLTLGLLYAGEPIFNTYMPLVLNNRNHPRDQSISEPSVIINGTEFTDVYSDSLSSYLDEFTLYYNGESGLIGIVKKDGTISLKFERFE